MSAGPGVLFGATGGYIFGFIFMTFLCGVGRTHMKKGAAGIVWLVGFSALGLAACHILGIIQLKFVAKMTWGSAALVGSVPYLAKDIASVIGAYIVAVAIRQALKSTSIFDWENKNKANA
jgi:biotin transport system substrate-specific component